LAAKNPEEVELGGGVRRSLLRVESRVTGPDGQPIPGMDPTYWVDEGGQILKSFTNALGGLTTYRTSREAATAPTYEKLDLLRQSIVKVTQKIPNPESRRDIVYRVSMKEDDPTKILPSDRRQSVKKGTSPGSATLEVRTAGKDEGSPGPVQVDDQFLRPNPLINSADPKVVELMHKAVGNATDPWS